MRLAALMHRPLSQLGEEMTAEEFGLWRVFLEEEPIGLHAMPAMMAALLAALANGPLQPPEGRKSWRFSDFMPRPWRKPEPKREQPAPVDQFRALFKR